LTEIFRTQKDPEALVKNISILASKGINFNENMRGDPAVTHLRCFSAPLLKVQTLIELSFFLFVFPKKEEKKMTLLSN